jgi:hypothetical protein
MRADALMRGPGVTADAARSYELLIGQLVRQEEYDRRPMPVWRRGMRGLRPHGSSSRSYESALAGWLELRSQVLLAMPIDDLRAWIPTLRGEVKRLIDHADPLFDALLSVLERFAQGSPGASAASPQAAPRPSGGA